MEESAVESLVHSVFISQIIIINEQKHEVTSIEYKNGFIRLETIRHVTFTSDGQILRE